MLVRAKTSFAGTFSMYKGEEKEYGDEAILQDLINAGYVEEVKSGETEKDVKSNESKRNNSKKSD